jgi:signal transduction histidine kinase
MTGAPPPGGTRAPVASFRLRLLFRGVFLLLAVATVALAIVLLQDEKERSYRSYHQSLSKTHADIVERLRQPAGMLALLNPQPAPPPPLRPLVLPFSALDFQDPNSVHQMVDQSECSVRYADGASLCVAVGGTAKAGAFLYLVGSANVPPLARWDAATGDPAAADRVAVAVELGAERQAWVAVFDTLSSPDEAVVRGRMLGYEAGDAGAGAAALRPARDFSGDFWQSATCAGTGALPDCSRRVFYAMRVPAKALRERLAPRARPTWPPKELDQVRVRLAIFAPGAGPALFDSDSRVEEPPASLRRAVQSLRPGEVLRIASQDVPAPLIVLKGADANAQGSSPLLLRLVSGLPVSSPASPVEVRETVVTPVGSYEVRLAGDRRAIDPGLGAVATRISWYVAAMLSAIALAWLAIEVGLIRRILVLSRRAAAVSHDVRENARGGDRIGKLEVSDLRGPDELGVLAGGLADLLQRVKDDLEREEARARQEREMLEAVGHEILSPLQSLMALFPDPEGPAYRYVHRMRQAVGLLYGQASPREALQAVQLQLTSMDLDEFLTHIASNAGFVGIADVRYEPLRQPVVVRADEFSLEDVVTHILRNADRHRMPGTPITLSLAVRGSRAVVRIHNVGAPVEEALLERMFDYGMRDAEADRDAGAADPNGRRGQGLFVARTYMSKMGGAVTAHNEDGGVAFRLELPLDARPR